MPNNILKKKSLFCGCMRDCILPLATGTTVTVKIANDPFAVISPVLCLLCFVRCIMFSGIPFLWMWYLEGISSDLEQKPAWPQGWTDLILVVLGRRLRPMWPDGIPFSRTRYHKCLKGISSRWTVILMKNRWHVSLIPMSSNTHWCLSLLFIVRSHYQSSGNQQHNSPQLAPKHQSKLMTVISWLCFQELLILRFTLFFFHASQLKPCLCIKPCIHHQGGNFVQGWMNGWYS